VSESFSSDALNNIYSDESVNSSVYTEFPAYTAEEARSRDTFLALMWALSYPGRVYQLPASGWDAYRAIADTLLDLETSFYTPDAALADELLRTGARSLPPDRAAYHFYPTFTDAELEIAKTASTGTLLYPDQAATLIIGCVIDAGLPLTLSGPGIPPDETKTIHVRGVPDSFWELRRQSSFYPNGWDIYLIDDFRVIGLPRTTQIELKD
jgi:alpha-D-ribose 1-methylphosphonate 5-triphosphate synthase subunit PhnH